MIDRILEFIENALLWLHDWLGIAYERVAILRARRDIEAGRTISLEVFYGEMGWDREEVDSFAFWDNDEDAVYDDY